MTAAQRWTKHRPIALAIAREWRIPGMDLDDVRQEALVALWEAGKAYDQTKGAFPSFARLVIKRRMRDRLQAATRMKRTADFDDLAEAVSPDTVQLVLWREELREAMVSPRLEQRRKWREAKRRQTERKKAA